MVTVLPFDTAEMRRPRLALTKQTGTETGRINTGGGGGGGGRRLTLRSHLVFGGAVGGAFQPGPVVLHALQREGLVRRQDLLEQVREGGEDLRHEANLPFFPIALLHDPKHARHQLRSHPLQAFTHGYERERVEQKIGGEQAVPVLNTQGGRRFGMQARTGSTGGGTRSQHSVGP